MPYLRRAHFADRAGLTEEFLKEHKIHVVCMGQEYIDRWPDPKDDKYYSVPRIKGIHRILPRTGQ